MTKTIFEEMGGTYRQTQMAKLLNEEFKEGAEE